MSIFDKYGIEPEKVKAMIKDGIIPCSVVKRDEIYTTYKTLSKSVNKPDAVHQTAVKCNVTSRWVWMIIRDSE